MSVSSNAYKMITDYDNCLDDKVDEELLACLNLLQNPKSFFLLICRLAPEKQGH